ncbi:hypothetical protein AYO45_04980 [Gammaproteobacteria bacterium SCGC AG-212-F23]|nr:hypothetical protein AYO45_04980 [Gammaproteobacteria bacterium SCGC AG-212-F23]
MTAAASVPKDDKTPSATAELEQQHFNQFKKYLLIAQKVYGTGTHAAEFKPLVAAANYQELILALSRIWANTRTKLTTPGRFFSATITEDKTTKRPKDLANTSDPSKMAESKEYGEDIAMVRWINQQTGDTFIRTVGYLLQEAGIRKTLSLADSKVELPRFFQEIGLKLTVTSTNIIAPRAQASLRDRQISSAQPVKPTQYTREQYERALFSSLTSYLKTLDATDPDIKEFLTAKNYQELIFKLSVYWDTRKEFLAKAGTLDITGARNLSKNPDSPVTVDIAMISLLNSNLQSGYQKERTVVCLLDQATSVYKDMGVVLYDLPDYFFDENKGISQLIKKESVKLYRSGVLNQEQFLSSGFATSLAELDKYIDAAEPPPPPPSEKNEPLTPLPLSASDVKRSPSLTLTTPVVKDAKTSQALQQQYFNKIKKYLLIADQVYTGSNKDLKPLLEAKDYADFARKLQIAWDERKTSMVGRITGITSGLLAEMATQMGKPSRIPESQINSYYFDGAMISLINGEGTGSTTLRTMASLMSLVARWNESLRPEDLKTVGLRGANPPRGIDAPWYFKLVQHGETYTGTPPVLFDDKEHPVIAPRANSELIGAVVSPRVSIDAKAVTPLLDDKKISNADHQKICFKKLSSYINDPATNSQKYPDLKQLTSCKDYQKMALMLSVLWEAERERLIKSGTIKLTSDSKQIKDMKTGDDSLRADAVMIELLNKDPAKYQSLRTIAYLLQSTTQWNLELGIVINELPAYFRKWNQQNAVANNAPTLANLQTMRNSIINQSSFEESVASYSPKAVSEGLVAVVSTTQPMIATTSTANKDSKTTTRQARHGVGPGSSLVSTTQPMTATTSTASKDRKTTTRQASYGAGPVLVDDSEDSLPPPPPPPEDAITSTPTTKTSTATITVSVSAADVKVKAAKIAEDRKIAQEQVKTYALSYVNEPDVKKEFKFYVNNEKVKILNGLLKEAIDQYKNPSKWHRKEAPGDKKLYEDLDNIQGDNMEVYVETLKVLEEYFIKLSKRHGSVDNFIQYLNGDVAAKISFEQDKTDKVTLCRTIGYLLSCAEEWDRALGQHRKHTIIRGVELHPGIGTLPAYRAIADKDMTNPNQVYNRLGVSLPSEEKVAVTLIAATVASRDTKTISDIEKEISSASENKREAISDNPLLVTVSKHRAALVRLRARLTGERDAKDANKVTGPIFETVGASSNRRTAMTKVFDNKSSKIRVLTKLLTAIDNTITGQLTAEEKATVTSNNEKATLTPIQYLLNAFKQAETDAKAIPSIGKSGKDSKTARKLQEMNESLAKNVDAQQHSKFNTYVAAKETAYAKVRAAKEEADEINRKREADEKAAIAAKEIAVDIAKRHEKYAEDFVKQPDVVENFEKYLQKNSIATNTQAMHEALGKKWDEKVISSAATIAASVSTSTSSAVPTPPPNAPTPPVTPPPTAASTSSGDQLDKKHSVTPPPNPRNK